MFLRFSIIQRQYWCILYVSPRSTTFLVFSTKIGRSFPSRTTTPIQQQTSLMGITTLHRSDHGGKIVPKKGPQNIQKVQRVRRYIRSMVGVDSRNVSVQAELDPKMTLRKLLEAQPSLESENRILHASKWASNSDVKPRTSSSKPLLVQTDSLNKDLASLDINSPLVVESMEG